MSLSVVGADVGTRARAGFSTAEQAANLGLGLGQDDADVRRRRAALEQWVGAPVAFARQVHGAAVLVDPEPGPGATVGTGDALVTTSSGVALAVLVADCVPVLLADGGRGVVGAVHAGRRGLLAGVVERALEAMAGLGADLTRTVGVIGPAACGACYEVPAAMRDEVAASVPGVAGTTSWGTPSLDLPSGVATRLRAAGVEVRRHGGCTIEDPRWFSHRAASGHGARSPAGGAPETTAHPRPHGRLAGVVRLLPVL